MKKITFSFKSLLLAAGLLLGSANAWAEVVETTVVNCDFESGETLFSATKDPGNATRVTVSNAGEESAHYVNFANGGNAANGNAIATYNFNTLTNDASAVDIEFDVYLSSGSPNYHHIFTIGDASKRAHTSKSINNAGAIFTFGMKRGKWNGSGSNVNYWSINNAYTTNSETNFGRWLHVKVYVDLANKKVNYTIKNQAQTETINSGTDIAFLDVTASACTQIDYNSCLNNGSGRVDNLVIKKYKDNSAVATTYTVKYQDTNGSTLKEDAVYDIYVGNVYSASASDMATFYNDGSTKKYVYKSGQNTEIEASETASENVITLVFDTYSKYNYTITSSYNEKPLPWSVSGWCWEDENTFNVRYPRYQAIETKLVGRAPVSNNLTASVTVTGDGYSQDLEYTKAVDDLLYWSEAENMGSGLSTHATSFTDRVSNSKIVYGASGKIATLLPGTYRVALGVIGHANDGDAATVTYKIKAGDEDKKTFTCTSNTLTLGVTDEFTLTETTNITFTCDQYATSRGVDFVYITGTVDDLAANTSVTSLIKNPDVEEDESNGAWQQTVKGWYNTDNVVNYRPLAFTPAQNPNGAFTGTYAYENWTSAAGGLTGQMSQTIGGLPNGVYKLQMAALVRTVNGQFIYGKSNGKTYKTTLSGANETANDYEVIVVVEDNQLEIGLDMNNSGADWAAIDNARLTYMPTVSATISAAGYATFSSEYALDLTTANTPVGLTAYYINSTELTKDNAPFTTINQTVAAGEGILLKGDEGTYNIKVAASGDALEDNALVATNGSAITAGNYVFAYEKENPSTTAGFYYVSDDTDPVAAGKAYLNGTLVPTNVKAFIFDGTTTGIETAPAAEAEEDGVYYNTAGQVVTKDYKGIVIVNGKKFYNK